MNRLISIVLTLMLVFSVSISLAEETAGPAQTITVTTDDYQELVVGTATAMSGCFFGDVWGENTADMDIRSLLHSYSLITWHNDTGAYGINPTVVSGMSVTDDAVGNRTYTMALYNDLTYSDGTPVTAWDYAFSILLSVCPQMKEIGASTVQGSFLLGADEYRSGEAYTLAGVRVLSRTQLAITVQASYLPCFYELAPLDFNPYPIAVIAPNCRIQDQGEGVFMTGPFTADLLRATVLDPEKGYLSHPDVTTGPYRLTSYDADAKVASFEINPYFKGDEKGRLPRIERLVFKWVPSEQLMDQIASGEIDLVNKIVNADQIDEGMQLLAAGKVAATNYARSGFSFISFSCERPATSSVAVRQAISHCFDKDAFIQQYVRNYGSRVDGYYGLGQWMYTLVQGSVMPPVTALDENASSEEVAAYESTMDAWKALKLDNVKTYPLDVNAAAALLEADGWKLNAEGVRTKVLDGEEVTLELKLLYPEGNAVGAALEQHFVPYLREAGITLQVEGKSFPELLQSYYRQTPRDCDMIYLASNFADLFDPSLTFATEDAYQGIANRTGISDSTLYQRAFDMRLTAPGDVLGYCRKWVSFQERWSEVVPAIPVYSNVYFDFHTPTLHNYYAGSSTGWAQAILGAYLSDAEAAPAVPDEGQSSEDDDLLTIE